MEMVWLRSELQDQRDRLQEALLASQKQAAKAAQQDGEGGGEGGGSPGSGGGGGSPGQHRAARSPRLRMPGSGGGSSMGRMRNVRHKYHPCYYTK
jgi:hypothetical protein